jgi:hypothetical protein
VFTSAEQRTANVQYSRHRLPWTFGTYTFEQAINGIQEHVFPHQLVFVKGLEKAKFLNRYIRNITVLPEKPAMKELNNCLDKICWIPHGKCCACRKVFELLNAFKPVISPENPLIAYIPLPCSISNKHKLLMHASHIILKMESSSSRDETDFDLVDVVNKVLPFEKHVPGCNYLGPGTNLSKKLNSDNSVKESKYEPVDRIDHAAMLHDIRYTARSDFRGRHEADKEMLKSVYRIGNPTCRERCERFLVYIIMGFKVIIGSCVIRVMNVLGR